LGLQTSWAVIKIDATALIEAYENNEVAADAKYKGKEVEVTGEVNRISSTFGKSSVTLGGLIGVTCYFSKAQINIVPKFSTHMMNLITKYWKSAHHSIQIINSPISTGLYLN
jgi:hypothetical protein